LAEHFIKQRSYYPIFPPSAGHGKDFNLDVTKMEAYAMPVQPDVLILPSKLTGIVMDVANGTTVVNPGHLVKGAVGGTYAIVDIHPRKKDDLETNAKTDVGHPIKDRIRVEVRKI
jgi:DNA polymerase alpha subunit B